MRINRSENSIEGEFVVRKNGHFIVVPFLFVSCFYGGVRSLAHAE